MTYLRHAARHLQQTVADHVEATLTSLGWIGPSNGVPFGAKPVDYQVARPTEDELKSVEPNLVAISFGAEPDDVEEEMGGGLLSVEHVFFVDCYMAKEALAIAIGSDLKDTLAGRAPGTSRFIPLTDYKTTTPVLGYQIEFDDVIREPVQRELTRVHWQVVKATAVLTYPGEA